MTKYAKEISLVLIIKCLFIFALWFLFFQHPVEEKLDTKAIARHIVSE